MQAANSDYASFAIEEDRVFFDLFHFARANSQTRIPGYFPMLGGPAFGPNALVKIIKHYGWQRCATSGFVQSSTRLASEGLLLRGLNRVAMYYQNAPSEVITADTFLSLALLEGVQFELQKRESSTAKGVEIDYQDLLSAESNVFIFFGGSQLDSLLGSFRQSLALFQACSYKLQSLHRRTETCCRRWML